MMLKILKYIQIENKLIVQIFHNITAHIVFFNQINAALVNIRDFFQKH